MATESPSHQHELTLHIDRRPYEVRERELTGVQLRALPVPPIGTEFDLWLEETGSVEDKLVEDADPLKLKDNMHFYSAPRDITPGLC